MKNVILIIGILIALVVGGGVGYTFGKGANMDAGEAKKLQDSITMMKEQSATIKKMGEMMKTGGVALQSLGMKYNDDAAVSSGKDLEVVAEKYMGENEKAAGESSTMKQIME